MKRTRIIAIAAIVILVLVLGIIFFTKTGGNKASNIPYAKPTRTPDELEALALARQNSDNTKQMDLLVKLTKDTGNIEIGKCSPTPLVAVVKNGGQITINNPDDTDHVLIAGSDNIYTIRAKTEEKITIKFEKVPGMYAYGCDNSTTPVGFFSVSE